MKKWIEFGFFSGLGLYNLLLRFFAESFKCYIKSKYVCVKKYCLNQTLGFIVLVMQKDLFQPEINVTQEILKIESDQRKENLIWPPTRKRLSNMPGAKQLSRLSELCDPKREKKNQLT